MKGRYPFKSLDPFNPVLHCPEGLEDSRLTAFKWKREHHKYLILRPRSLRGNAFKKQKVICEWVTGPVTKHRLNRMPVMAKADFA